VERLVRWAEIAVIAFIGVWLINKGLDAAGLPQFKA